MPSYQADLLTRLAEQLDRRARVVPWICAGGGAAAGFAGGYMMTLMMAIGSWLGYSVVFGAGLGAVAYFLANVKAVAFQLDAQAALCQKQIEENTRSR
jgi:hypothetical protein